MSDSFTSTSVSASAPGGRTSWLRRLLPDSRRNRALLYLPAASALFTLVAMAFMSGAFDPDAASDATSSDGGFSVDGFIVGLVIYNLLPPLVLAALIVLAAHILKRGMPAVVVGSIVYTAATVALLADMLFSESSTSALLLLFLPMPLGVILVATAAAAVLVQDLRSRSTSR